MPMKSRISLKHPLSLSGLCGALLATLATAPSAHAQTPVITWAQTYGVAPYTNDGQPVSSPSDYSRGADLPNAIAPMPDGGAVVGGQLELNKYYSNPSGIQTGGALVRYDRSGNIVWQTLLRQDNDGGGQIAGSTVSFLRTDAAGNIFAAGVKRTLDGSLQPVFVAKFASDDGKPITVTKEVGDPTAMDLTDDGGVILGGSIGVEEFRAGDSAHSCPTLIKFNADSSVGFHRIYDNNNQYSPVRSVCQAVGGQSYAVLLSTDDQAPGVATILLTDTVGNPTSQRSFFNPGTGVPSVPHFITRDTDGGYFEMNESSYLHTEVRKLRADLTTVWASSWPTTRTMDSNSAPRWYLWPVADALSAAR